MQTISVQTTQNVSIQYPVASVGDRILAHLLDRIILIGYSIVVIAAFINLELEVMWVWIMFLAVPWLFYFLFFEIFMNGQTPGKRVMNIQVVRLDGTEPGIGDYILRWVFSLVDFYILSGAIAVVIVAANGRGQRLGDIVAGTSVVKLIAPREVTANEVFITPDDGYQPVFQQAMQLDARDIELIQRALEANHQHGNIQPMLMVSQKIKSHLVINSDMPDERFLTTIVKDYNHLTAL